MKFSILLVTILVTCAIQTQGYTRTDRRVSAIEKRQATNADQMVQNILQWLQGVYAQNSRRVRQGSLREYLPPSNTEKPRPFQPGYQPAGFSPEPPFPFPTNPATGGVTAPEGYQPEAGGNNDVLMPPEQGSGGGENGYQPPGVQPGLTLPTSVPSTIQPGAPTTPGAPGPEQPTEKNIPQEQPGYPTGQPSYTTGQPTLPTGGPAIPSEEQPGPYPTYPGTISEDGGSTTGTLVPGYPTAGQPESTFTSQSVGPTQGPEQPQPSLPPYTSPEVSTGTPQPVQEGTPGYPAIEQPQSTPGQPEEQPSPSVQPEAEPEIPTRVPASSGSTLSPLQPGTPEVPSSTELNLNITPEQPGVPTEGQPIVVEETSAPEGPASEAPEGPGAEIASGSTIASADNLVPSGFTTSTTSAPISETSKPEGGTPEGAPSEGTATTLSPEVNTIPGPGQPEPSVIDEEELKHPPHIHAIDVQCSKEMMTITIEFNREFNGVIYSKGHYNKPECRYVQENSAQTKYTFTVNLEMCGTEFVNAFDTENQSYLENVLVLQNEAGIQEIWDTVRAVRCLWEGNVKDTLSVAFSIGMLSQEIVTFSGDTAMAKLDVVLGRGPFGEPANGLVKIGEQMSLVVSVSGDPGFDLQVKDCKAIDSDGKNSVALTDDDGCILKPKLFGAFQKTRETGTTGASIIAYAYFNAFKFPDEMDLMIECNIELCKTDCDMCSKDGQQLEPAKRRRRDVSSNNTVIGDWVTMGKLVRVILPEDLNEKTALEVSSREHICMTITSFVFSTAVLVSLLVISSFTCVCLWMKRKEKMHLKY